MPQTAPLNWLILFFIFIYIFIMFNLLNYFNFYNTFSSMKILNPKSFKNKKFNNNNWLW